MAAAMAWLLYPQKGIACLGHLLIHPVFGSGEGLGGIRGSLVDFTGLKRLRGKWNVLEAPSGDIDE